jgi:multidrug efflux pump subunit AcrA (membrane-fusion protein)
LLTGLRRTSAADVLLPVNAVLADSEEQPYVWLVDEESMTVSKLPIEVGEITGDRIEVKEGLEGGQSIAMSGVHLLDEGMVVTELEQSDETRK